MPQDIIPPLQSRSEKTLANMLDATERLLEDRSFEEISVADIVREASCSNGSFYARFREKSSMLPALYDRYDTLMRAHMEDWLGRCSQPSLSLKSLCLSGL